MQVKQVLKTASVMLNLADEFQLIFDGGSVDSQTQKEFDKLLTSLNLCYLEVCSDYLPLLEQESIFADNGKIFFTQLNKSVCQIISIKTQNGKNVKFTLFPNCIKTNYDGYLNITYSYIPSTLTLNDNFDISITEKCLSMGTCAEYCFINSFFDDAEIWDKRFKESLQLSLKKRGGIKLPKRRWL